MVSNPTVLDLERFPQMLIVKIILSQNSFTGQKEDPGDKMRVNTLCF